MLSMLMTALIDRSITCLDSARYSSGRHKEALCGSSSHLWALIHTDGMAASGAYGPMAIFWMRISAIIACRSAGVMNGLSLVRST